MVRVEFDIPEWAIGRHIHFFAGTELLGNKEFRREKIRTDRGVEYKEYYLPTMIKPGDGRCTGCGDCCESSGVPEHLLKFMYEAVRKLPEDHDFTKGPCALLTEEGCGLGAWIPFSCIRSNCEGWSENCTERLVKLSDDIVMLEVI